MTGRTLFDKIWDSHVVTRLDGNAHLIYIDRHLLHEANTAHAFEGLKRAGLPVRQPDLTLGTVDHVVPTTADRTVIRDPQARELIRLFAKNCSTSHIPGFLVDDPRQGIVHVVGPEQGFALPGCTLVCGDSHTSTHGAFGAWAFGIGISEVEHVLATQTLVQQRPRNMRVELAGTLPFGASAKDVILALIGHIGTAGGTGHVIEFTGSVVSSFSMDARMTLCNMAIEAGARAGLIAPDEVTIAALRGLPYAPSPRQWDAAVQSWLQLRTDPGARFDRTVRFDVSSVEPQVTWGTSPEDVVPISGRVPDPHDSPDPVRRAAIARATAYMGMQCGDPVMGLAIDRVFIGSCTNSRMEDLRMAAQVVRGRTVHSRVSAWVVPGSAAVRRQAEAEGIAEIFTAAGFEWRTPGCSMCLAMNEDHLEPNERCAATSNRNFEGRQGRGGRTHLMSPSMAAAAAIHGKIVDVREEMT